MDCDHVAVELESEPMNLSNSITVCHDFRCVVCRVSARIFEHQAVAP